MDFIITDQVTEQDKEEVRSGLLSYNAPYFRDLIPQDLGIFLLDVAGKKLAGLVGDTCGNWLYVKYLWVSEALRGQGIGSDLLRQGERTAIARGCKYALLDTFGFQAPGFYKKQGYQEAFVLQAYPVTGTKHYFTKTLS